MPRFFIDFQDGNTLIADEVGGEVGTFERARRDAIEAMQEYANHMLPDGEHRQFSVTIKDEEGEPVYRARLTFEGERLDGWETP